MAKLLAPLMLIRRIDKRTLLLYGIVFIGCLILFGDLSVLVGQDANWDLRNHRLFIGFQFIQNRFFVDLSPVGLQTYYNPLTDLPYYYLSMIGFPNFPRVVAFCMGTAHGIAAFVVVLIYSAIRSSRLRNEISPFAVGAALLIGLSGAAFISELGTTFNDVAPVIFVLLGLLFLLPEIDPESLDRTLSNYRFLVAGTLFGAAAGLKLTSMMFVPALVPALLLARPWRKRVVLDLVFLSVGGAIGFAVIDGWWALKVYWLTGNPIFPLYNQIFHSDWYPPIAFRDMRWVTRGWLQTLAYPFFWMRENFLVVTEVAFADARFAAGYVSMILILVASGFAYLFKRNSEFYRHIRSAFPPKSRFILLFIAFAYVIWQSAFAYLRYAIGIELLLGIPILLATYLVVYLLTSEVARRRRLDQVMVCWALLLFTWTHYPDWGRAPYGDTVFSVQAPRLPPNSMIVIVAGPHGYVAPFLRGENVRFIGLHHTTVEARGYRLWTETSLRIAAHDGPLFVLDRPDGAYLRGTLQELGLIVDEGSCQPIDTNLDKGIRLCQGHHTAR